MMKRFWDWLREPHEADTGLFAWVDVRTARTPRIFLAYLSGERGEYLLSSDWLRVLDVPAGEASGQVGAAHRLGLLNFFRSGSVVQITFPELLKPAGD